MSSKPALRREGRLAVTVGVLVALLAPVAFDRDSFPLSTYPMYSRARGSESTIVTAQGVLDDGSRRELTPTLIGDSDDPLLVVGELRAALSAGRAAARCGEIAERVAGRSSMDGVDRVEVVSERHDTVERARGDDGLVERTVHASCEVRRS